MEKPWNDEVNPFANLNVLEDEMESMKDDLEMMKEKFHEDYGMTSKELVDIDFEISVTSTSSMMKSNQLIVQYFKANL